MKARIVATLTALSASLGVTALLIRDTAPLAAAPPAPDPGVLLGQLVRYSDLAQLKPVEARLQMAQGVASQLVSGGYGEFALLASESINAAGQPRAVFTIFDTDPDTGEWRPVSSIDSPMENGLLVETVLQIPSGPEFVAFLGASAGSDVAYRAKDGRFRPLGVKGPAGFAPLPADAAAPLELSDTSNGGVVA